MVKKIDEKMFYAVKALLEAGSTIPETAKYLKLGEATVGRIKAAESLQDYQQTLAAIALANKARKTAEKAPEQAKPQVVYHQTDNYTVQLLKEQNELLKLISAKLVFIVEQLT